jgi:hypothetical protein
MTRPSYFQRIRAWLTRRLMPGRWGNLSQPITEQQARERCRVGRELGHVDDVTITHPGRRHGTRTGTRRG